MGQDCPDRRSLAYRTASASVWLDAHTKLAQRGILIDGATAAAVGERVPLEPMGEVQFKGKGAEVPVFAVKAPPQR